MDYRVIGRPELIDIVDESWASDKLPDDFIPVPEQFSALEMDSAATTLGLAFLKSKGTKEWTDLGIFLK
ncbi:hypothetical protein CEUSTIGMA_g7198.t1 [Chlamydomonas eustigma]|uniref:Anaphase-promoting complex subunit 13 n=1 Tax=Chlamydomonas eustigma TaxID=1157962 RepID=A0A250X9L4_9CHLO|nr:hypothetical protein CEUSTIGMA_g7198.t1 [Chlamydomonas eustigma]|eukprot:GAX79757.1 hypothetical protein CEUSTIGMA_g7198.t1 [Chlamydomonas eustigma]